MKQLSEKWEVLKKALDHKKSIPSMDISTPKAKEEFPTPSSEHLANAKYGVENIPDTHRGTINPMGYSKNMGITKHGQKDMVIRHGAAAHRTAVEHEMSKLLGADHMLAQQSYDPGVHHPDHHQQPSYDRNLHGGTSIQEHVGGKPLTHLLDKKDELEPLRDQWKNGDLHKLWALHYISNNGDMHSGNFNITKDGIKAFDSDHAFHELPLGHMVNRYKDGKPQIQYMPMMKELPSYLYPFMENKGENMEEIPPVHKGDQPGSQAINEHAKAIDPEQFKQYGKHAYSRAREVKAALMSSDPTDAMLKLWSDHKNKTGGQNGK